MISVASSPEWCGRTLCASSFYPNRSQSVCRCSPPDTEGITDSSAQAVSFPDREVDHRSRTLTTYLEHGENVVGSVECPALIGRGLDHLLGTGLLDDAVGHPFGVVQPRGVDVHQRDGGLAEFAEEGQVA